MYGVTMDNSVLDQLDILLQKVGADTLWKKTLGGRTIWLRPISYMAQEKVTEALTSGTGISGLSDSKRITLSNAIVGIDDYDLLVYADKGPVFPVKAPNGNVVLSSLDRYLYAKLGEWGAQFLDDLFSLYADLMDVYQRDNLQSIKFEESDSLVEQLREAEGRVKELRERIGQPETPEVSPNAVPVQENPSSEEQKPVMSGRFE